MRVLVLGASGMIGSAMVRVLSENKSLEVFGSLRAENAKQFFTPLVAEKLFSGFDMDNHDSLVRIFSLVQPQLVINCIGLTKHHKESEDPALALPINALLPHRIANLCSVARARFIHISTDCVFSGLKGSYNEDDPADAFDVYGKSKFLGEVNYPHAVTLRTSTIGHEFHSKHGLLEWFLSQQRRCKGFSRAIFSGLPSTVFAQVVRDVVLQRPDLTGLYHVGAAAVNKFELLSQIAKVYGKKIEISHDETFMIDRSLDCGRFSQATGYVAPAWPELIQSMYVLR
jgi:dTDP-4-dehydrorhamnose reductase